MNGKAIKKGIMNYINISNDMKLISHESNPYPKEYHNIIFEYNNREYMICVVNYSYSYYVVELYDIERNKQINAIKEMKKYFNDRALDEACNMMDSIVYYDYK